MEEKNYFYIDNDGNQQGPRLLSQLKTDKVICRSTLVWCNGMSDWKAAFSVDDFNNFWFDENQPPPPPTSSYNEPPKNDKPTEPEEKMPHTWLVESIVATVLLCLVTGIIGLVYALKVESSWKKGDYEEARSAAKIAKIMFFISLAWVSLGLIALFFGVFALFMPLLLLN